MSDPAEILSAAVEEVVVDPNDLPQELFVQTDNGLRSFSGMSKNAVDELIAASGFENHAFITKEEFETAMVDMAPALQVEPVDEARPVLSLQDQIDALNVRLTALEAKR